MRSTQRFLLGFSLIGALCGLLGDATPAFACSCAEATSAEQFDNATAVFVGTVKSISEDGRQRSVDFDVSESRKGSISESVTVTTGWSEAECGFNFEAGREYIIYASGQGQLSTNICSGTSLLVADAQDGNDEVGMTSVPAVSATESNNGDDSIAPLVIVAVISFSAGALAAHLTGRKKRIT